MSGVAARSPERQPRTRPAPGAPERAPLAVVPRTRNHATRVPFVTLVSLLLLAGVVGLLLFNTSMQQASFATTALEEQASTLAARQQTLQVELDALRSPQRVAEQARDLGMVLPAAPVFLDLRTGRVTGADAAAEPLDLRLLPKPPVKPEVLAPAPRVVRVPATTATTASGAGLGEASRYRATDRDRNGSTSAQQARGAQQPQERGDR